MKYQCWNPDMGHEGQDDGERIDTLGDVGFAAERYVEQNFDRWEYPSESDVMLRDERGRTFSVNVTVESVPAFHAGKPKEAQTFTTPTVTDEDLEAIDVALEGLVGE